MGTPTPPPPVPGDNCARCDDVLWTPGNTPRFVAVTFANLVKCPACPVDPPDGIFWFEQHSLVACFWLYEDSLYQMDLSIDAAESVLFATSPELPPAWTFFDSLELLCATVFNNLNIACGGTKGSIDGTGAVGWPGV